MNMILSPTEPIQCRHAHDGPCHIDGDIGNGQVDLQSRRICDGVYVRRSRIFPISFMAESFSSVISSDSSSVSKPEAKCSGFSARPPFHRNMIIPLASP